MGALAALLSRSRIFTTLTAATPGMRELLTIGKVWELAQHERAAPRGGGPTTWSCSTRRRPGMVWRCCRRPRTFASVARVGPVAKQGRAIASFLADPRRHGGVGRVDAPRRWRSPRRSSCARDCGSSWAWTLALVVVNAVVPHRFSGARSGRYGRRRPRRRGTRRCSRPPGRATSARRSPGCDRDCRAWSLSRFPSCSSPRWIGRRSSDFRGSWSVSVADANGRQAHLHLHGFGRCGQDDDRGGRRDRVSRRAASGSRW